MKTIKEYLAIIYKLFQQFPESSSAKIRKTYFTMKYISELALGYTKSSLYMKKIKQIVCHCLSNDLLCNLYKIAGRRKIGTFCDEIDLRAFLGIWKTEMMIGNVGIRFKK